jgi:HEAT repeat protein
MEDDKKQKGSLITRFIQKFKSPKRLSTNPINRKIDISPEDYSLQELIRLSKHSYGFKREKAVVWLGNSGQPSVIPTILIRCNDWVEQVRSVAKEALLKLAVSNNAKAYIEILPDLYHLQHCGRENHQNFIKAIEKFLLLDKNKHHLIDGIKNENLKISKLCFSLVLDNSLLGADEILSFGLENENVSIRLKCFDLISKLDGKSRDKALSIAVKDKYMPVRRGALNHLVQVGVTDELLKPYLFDRHSSIREIAMKNLQHLDLKNIYVEELKSNSVFRVCCSIWGLGALRDLESLSKIESLLTSPFPSIRRHCLTTFTRLKGLDAEDVVLQSLVDESPKVAKEASRLAAKINIILSADELLKLYNTSHHYHSLISCASILKRMNKWERLIFTLRLLGEDSNVEIQQVEREINDWNQYFNRVLSQPSNKQIEVLGQLYTKYNHTLSEEVNIIIQFTLKTYSNN